MRKIISLLGIVIVLSMITATGITGSVIFASSNNNDDINLTGGKLIVKKADDLTINLYGQSGEKGEKGDKGDPGQNGNDGLPGANGQDGKNGINGTNGVDGQDGAPGQNGTTLSDETIAALNQLQNQSGVLNDVYNLYQKGSLSSVLICYAADNGTDNCSPIPLPEPQPTPDNGTNTDGGNGTEPVIVGNVTEPQ